MIDGLSVQVRVKTVCSTLDRRPRAIEVKKADTGAVSGASQTSSQLMRLLRDARLSFEQEESMKSSKRADKAAILFPTGLPTSKPVRYEAGETIFSQGDECTAVHYIAEGVVKLTLVSKRGRAGVLGFLGRGDFFGENCISSQAYYSTSAVAIVDGSIMVISRSKHAEDSRTRTRGVQPVY